MQARAWNSILDVETLFSDFQALLKKFCAQKFLRQHDPILQDLILQKTDLDYGVG